MKTTWRSDSETMIVTVLIQILPGRSNGAPSEIGLLKGLKKLDLSLNRLVGTIRPDSLAEYAFVILSGTMYRSRI